MTTPVRIFVSGLRFGRRPVTGTTRSRELIFVLTHLFACLIVVCGDPLDEALRVLATPAARYEQIRTARSAIEAGSPEDDSSWTVKLLDIWIDAGMASADAQLAAIELACAKAGDVTAPTILSAAEGLLKRSDSISRERARQFFGGAAESLSRRVTDPEQLISLAARHGFIATIPRLAGSPELRGRYLIEALRQLRDPSSALVAPFPQLVPELLIPKLRETMRELRISNPRSAEFRVCLLTLVQIDDGEIVGDLESMSHDSTLPSEHRQEFLTYLAKLRWQHSPEQVLNIVRTERENQRLLTWAIYRLLWLKVSKSSIREALAENRTPSSSGRDFAGGISRYFFPDEGWAGGLLGFMTSDPLMLDAAERRALESQPADKLETLRRVNRLSLAGVVNAAPD